MQLGGGKWTAMYRDPPPAVAEETKTVSGDAGQPREGGEPV